MNDLISEFFDEAVAHIIPGLVVIFLFAHQCIPEIFSALHDSSFTFWLFVALTAWLIGLTLDTAAVAIYYLFSGLLQLWLGSPTPKKKFESLFPDEPKEFTRHIQLGHLLVEKIYPNPELRRQFLWRVYRQAFMVSAQKNMFRNLALIFFATTIPVLYKNLAPLFCTSQPGFCLSNCLLYPKPFSSQPLSDFNWQWWYGFAATIVFSAAWWWNRSPLPLEKERPALPKHRTS